MVTGKRLISRRLLICCLVTFLGLALSMSTSSVAQAYHLLGGRWPGQPGANVCCANFNVEIISNISSKSLTGWQNANRAWTASVANVIVNPVSSAVISESEYNFGSTGCGGCDGITYLNPCNNCTYTSASLYVNPYYTSQSQYTNAVVQSVTAHEVGHLFGLAHTSACVLMNPFTFGSGSRWQGCGINTPQSDDTNGVNAQY